jgi:hypothetical protein
MNGKSRQRRHNRTRRQADFQDNDWVSRKSCVDKVTYSTKAGAKDGWHGCRGKVYRCPHCGLWHRTKQL